MRVGINRSCDNACHVRPFYLVGPNSSYRDVQDKITYQSQILNWFMIQFITINQEKKNNTPVMGLSAIPSSTQFTKIRIAFLFLFKKKGKKNCRLFCKYTKKKAREIGAHQSRQAIPSPYFFVQFQSWSAWQLKFVRFLYVYYQAFYFPINCVIIIF